ncbi:hypothetical protein BS627_14995 [Agrobacterium salinitolerans]|nr:hypothetical protein BS627_14995 [Agrobacterium salinitolerans]PNQ22444.1 hypothetical protein C2E26_15265 [Rhizobium sp. YIC5082]
MGLELTRNRLYRNAGGRSPLATAKQAILLLEQFSLRLYAALSRLFPWKPKKEADTRSDDNAIHGFLPGAIKFKKDIKIN